MPGNSPSSAALKPIRHLLSEARTGVWIPAFAGMTGYARKFPFLRRLWNPSGIFLSEGHVRGFGFPPSRE